MADLNISRGTVLSFSSPTFLGSVCIFFSDLKKRASRRATVADLSITRGTVLSFSSSTFLGSYAFFSPTSKKKHRGGPPWPISVSHEEPCCLLVRRHFSVQYAFLSPTSK
ncbi:hypothetical protein V5799_022956 [Amblyomma americanum]|uniref:Uncharacterized protein n=1 Tax=Amblyomma americanum TaxID=6943 RepID=A0AAQ4FL06_AMBAM